MRSITPELVICVALSVVGCGTIGNEILVFGTDTKVALDVSGDPTGQPSITLGYKRREAVWLPLATGIGGKPTHLCIPGKDATGTKDLLTCADVGEKVERGTHVCVSASNGIGNASVGKSDLLCEQISNVRKTLYVGGEKDQPDAYSVMASFGLKTSGKDAEIAQYIATGQAARNLTERGGAALVSTNQSTVDTVLAKEQRAIIKKENEVVERIMSHVTNKDGSLDVAKYSALVKSAVVKDAGAKMVLSSIKEPEKIRAYLRDNFEIVGKPMYDALP